MQATMLQGTHLRGIARPFTHANKAPTRVFHPVTQRRTTGEGNKRNSSVIGFLPAGSEHKVVKPPSTPVNPSGGATPIIMEGLSHKAHQMFLEEMEGNLFTDTLLTTPLAKAPQVHQRVRVQREAESDLMAQVSVNRMRTELLRERLNMADCEHQLLELEVKERVMARKAAQQAQFRKVVARLALALSVAKGVTHENHINHFAEEVFLCGRQHEEDTMRECMDFRVAAMGQLMGFDREITRMVGGVMGLMVKSQAAPV